MSREGSDWCLARPGIVRAQLARHPAWTFRIIERHRWALSVVHPDISELLVLLGFPPNLSVF